MKKNTFLRVFTVTLLIAGGLLMYGYDCFELQVYTVIKFKDGQDMSRQYVTRGKPERNQNNGLVLLPLHNGYYLCMRFSRPYESHPNFVYLFSFTNEELSNGEVPEDWANHWRDYVVADGTCIEDLFEVMADCCEKDCGHPAYCNHCDPHLDTTILNKMIDDSTLWEYPGRWMIKDGRFLYDDDPINY